MNNVRGSRPPTEEVRGGTAMPRTCTQPHQSLGSTAWVWFRCWIHSGVSRWFHEPPDAEPHVRWCGRTAGVIPPPTRLRARGAGGCHDPRAILGGDLRTDTRDAQEVCRSGWSIAGHFRKHAVVHHAEGRHFVFGRQPPAGLSEVLEPHRGVVVERLCFVGLELARLAPRG